MPEAETSRRLAATLTHPSLRAGSPLSRNAGEGAERGGAGEGFASEPLAIYIHWPFCRSKCPYCDFNSHVRDGVDTARWTRALLADLDHHAALLPGRAAGSVFFGGGTPSLMPPETVAALLERVRRHWPIAADVEITLEANPNSAEAARFGAFAAAGVNRLSLGVQALDPTALRFLGRAHDRAEAIAAIEHAREAFARFSFDLIYARPGQSCGPMAARARRGAEPGRRPSLALSADDRARHRLCHPGPARRPGPGRRRCGGRALRADPGPARRRRTARLRDLQPRASGRRMPP